MVIYTLELRMLSDLVFSLTAKNEKKNKVDIYADSSQCLGFNVKLIPLILTGILKGATRAVWAVGKARGRQKTNILILFTGRALLVLRCCSCSHADPRMWQLSHDPGTPDCPLSSVPQICEMEFHTNLSNGIQNSAKREGGMFVLLYPHERSCTSAPGL